jgi:hypothetical protein
MNKGARRKAPHRHKEPIRGYENNVVVMRATKHNSQHNTACGSGCLGEKLKQLSDEEIAGLRLDRSEWYCDANGRGEELARIIIKNGWEGAIPQIANALAACPWETNRIRGPYYFEDYLDRWVEWIKAKEVAK